MLPGITYRDLKSQKKRQTGYIKREACFKERHPTEWTKSESRTNTTTQGRSRSIKTPFINSGHFLAKYP